MPEFEVVSSVSDFHRLKARKLLMFLSIALGYGKAIKVSRCKALSV
jgi:hypothetical protein